MLAGPCRLAQALDVVRVPRPTSDHDARRNYSRALLAEVLRRTEPAFGPYTLEESDSPMTRGRLLLEMRDGVHVNVVANPADDKWLRELKAVWVPIDMGLQGWRIALIRRSQQAEIEALPSIAAFKAMRFGVASVWITRTALEQSGFKTVLGENYDGLFGMLLAQRFDMLPRGINEIFDEYDQRAPANPELAIERRYLTHDHIVSLFFVSPKAPRLAERIAAGMDAMLKDGSLRRFLLAYHGEAIARARLCDRIVVDLPRPALPRELAGRPELWIDPFNPTHDAKGGCRAVPNRR
jgi:hypothetical protein